MVLPAFVLAVAGVLTGTGYEAIAAYEENIRSRTHAFTGNRQIEDISSQMRLAEAIINAETAETLRENALQKVTAAANRGDEITTEQRGRLRLESAFIAMLCRAVH